MRTEVYAYRKSLQLIYTFIGVNFVIEVGGSPPSLPTSPPFPSPPFPFAPLSYLSLTLLPLP